MILVFDPMKLFPHACMLAYLKNVFENPEFIFLEDDLYIQSPYFSQFGNLTTSSVIDSPVWDSKWSIFMI